MDAKTLARFEAKVVPEPMTGCWLWTGGVGANGYGVFSLASRSTAAHRISYEHSVGPITDGLSVCHRCDTPLCVNPDHLFVGTTLDNMRDCAAKNRASVGQANKTHCKRGHEFTPENTRYSVRRRSCRACERAASRAYKSRQANCRHDADLSDPV